MNNLTDPVDGHRASDARKLGSLLKTTETGHNTLRSQQASIGSLINQGN